ncbi:DWNN domain-containing protein [Lasiosphaeris hirsuta]|uniref:DWNN domain-containing protein n=1 Tax=Lasiosphaeris hirsuta TaxID=260670 RepID=A0AA40ARU3_9PEZI|nr:DWNN domain-containing protein [Lasiosphaeris hirsuta]
MASSVFFKFKSQKEPTRVEFDGTGISVFELKREIILRSGLGDGNDFDLVICGDEAMKEPFDDDTEIIPRSTTVIARRMPPRIQGRGGAARYVSGKMPVHAKNSSRKEQTSKPLIKPPSTTMAQLSSAMTEEEKMAAVFQAQTENFTAREEEMATQQYVAKGGQKKAVVVPNHEPPQGYICYRCGEKGHWIQLCPTNDNPDYDNRPRVKRTTGIPKSFLKTVDKATVLSQNADGDDTKTPSGIMVNPDGDWVIAEPDKASWEQFQAKAKSNASAQKATLEGDKEVQERGLECPIDKKMFIDPMKTPCCEKTYCNDCITNALIESDFVCPGCKTEGVLIDDLKPDEEAVKKMKSFLAERDSKAKAGSKSPQSPVAPKSPAAAVNGDATGSNGEPATRTLKSPSPPAAAATAQQQTSQPSQTSTGSALTPSSTASTPANGEHPALVTKKRPAEESLENPKIPKAPKAMQKQQGNGVQQAPTPQQQQQMQQALMDQMMMGGMPGMGMPGMGGMNGMGGIGGMPMMFPGMPMMGNFGGMGGMPGMNPMGGMMNPMMSPMMAGGMPGFSGMSGGGFNGANNMWGGAGGAGVVAGPDMTVGGAGMNMSMGNPAPVGPNMNRMIPGGMNNGAGAYNISNSQHHQQQQHQQQHPPYKNFSHQPADDEDAYFRKPVNPHRHQNRTRRVRPSDYREL